MSEINTNDQSNVVPIRPGIELPSGDAVQPDHMLPEGDHLADLPPVVDVPAEPEAQPTEDRVERTARLINSILGPAAEVANANKHDNRPPQPPAA